MQLHSVTLSVDVFSQIRVLTFVYFSVPYEEGREREAENCHFFIREEGGISFSRKALRRSVWIK